MMQCLTGVHDQLGRTDRNKGGNGSVGGGWGLGGVGKGEQRGGLIWPHQRIYLTFDAKLSFIDN